MKSQYFLRFSIDGVRTLWYDVWRSPVVGGRNDKTTKRQNGETRNDDGRQKTAEYVQRMDDMKDERAKARITSRVLRLCGGNPGDAKPLGEGVSEMRIHYGPGYRVYYKQKGEEIVILLLAGTKRNQSADIALAKQIAKDF